MALTNQPKPAFVGKLLGGRTEPTVTGYEAASQTFVAGAFVRDNDSGLIVESTSPVNGSAVGNRCIGIALAAASGVTAAALPIAPVVGSDVLLEITLSDATAGTHTLAQADQWKCYPITKGTANWYLDANAVSDTGGAVVVGFKDPIGTVDARVYAIVTRAAIGGVNAGSSAW